MTSGPHRTTARILLSALAAWTAWLLVIERSFLPDATRLLFDTRAVVWSNDDKIGELRFLEQRTLAEMAAAMFAKEPPDPRRGEHFNLLPRAVLQGARLGLPAVAAHNLVLLLSAVANCLAAAWLAAQLVRSRWVAFVAGVWFGAAPLTVRMLAFCSLDFAMMMWIPLWLGALLRVIERPTGLRVVAAGAALAGLGWTNVYYLLACVLPSAGIALATARSRRSLGGVAAAVGLGGALLAPALRQEWLAAAAAHGQQLSGLGLESIPPAPNLRALRQFWALDGWTLMVLPMATLGLLDRRRRGLVAALLALALGWSALMVDYRLGRVVWDPLVGALGFLWRARRLELTMVVPLLLLGAAAAVGVAAVNERLPRRGRVALAVGVLALAAWVTGPAHDREAFVARYEPFDLPPALLVALPPTGDRLALDAADRRPMANLAEFYLAQWGGAPVLPHDDPLVASVGAALLDAPVRGRGLDPGELRTHLDDRCVSVLLRRSRSTVTRPGPGAVAGPAREPAWDRLGMRAETMSGWALGTSAGCVR